MKASGQSYQFATAHPRSRGEHSFCRYWSGRVTGSSPLARGTSLAFSFLVSWHRLIPARAGNIYHFTTRVLFLAAHPRSRGEHLVLPLLCRSGGGSSPLARGTSTDEHGLRWYSRLIPARAGNIFPRPLRRVVTAAHPRSRGEHPGNAERNPVPDGSSPLARGTLIICRVMRILCRLIPARAGNIR